MKEKAMGGLKPERSKKTGRVKRELSGAPESRLRNEDEFKENDEGITVENPSQLDPNEKYPESHERRGVERKDPDGSARPL